jgi:hypothetical protein
MVNRHAAHGMSILKTEIKPRWICSELIVGRRKAKPMTAYPDDIKSAPEHARIDFAMLKTCSWGYTVSMHSGVASRHLMRVEAALTLFGFSIFAMILGLWLMPGTNYSMTVIGLKTGLSMAMGIAAMGMLELARRGLRREVQFDSARKQIRSVWRNRKNRTSLHSVMEFEEINSIFIRRRKMPQDNAVLNIRYGAKGGVLEVTSGAEDAMRALWEKLNTDLLRAMPERTSIVPVKRTTLTRQKRRRSNFGGLDQSMTRRSAFSSSSSSSLLP